METVLRVEQVAFGGKGVGRLENGKVCFVPWVLPGERVVVTVRRERARYAEADLVRVLEPSPDRVQPKCPVFGRCGGCQYQHIRYETQLAIKREQVADTLRRLAGIHEPVVEPVVPSPSPYFYRNRVTMHVRGGRKGFYAARSRRVVDVSECFLATDSVNALLRDLRAARPDEGEYPLREPGHFRGFRQVNDGAAARLLDLAAELAAPGGELLVDAYCGGGFFAKRLRTQFRVVVGIEWSPDAVRVARTGVRDGEYYLLGDVKRHLTPAFASAPPEATTLLLDPPAEGVDQEVLGLVRQRHVARVLYVSCNPATLARDLGRLGETYRVRRICPVDMFPQTAEIEVLTLLERS